MAEEPLFRVVPPEELPSTDLAPIELALAAGLALFLGSLASSGVFVMIDTQLDLGLRWVAFRATTDGALAAALLGLLLRYGRTWTNARLIRWALVGALVGHVVWTGASAAMFSSGPLGLTGRFGEESPSAIAWHVITSLAGRGGLGVVAHASGVWLAFVARAQKRVGLVYVLPGSLLVLLTSIPLLFRGMGPAWVLEAVVRAGLVSVLFPVFVSVVPGLLARLGIHTRPSL